MGGSPGTSTTVQQSEPWKEQKPYLQEGFQSAQEWFNSANPQYYNFPTTIPFSGQTQAALQQQQAMAQAGSPVAQGAANTVMQMMGGGQNPNLDAMFNQAAGNLAQNFRMNVNPQIEAYYEGLGGSPMNPSMLQSLQLAQKQQYTDPMTSLATQMYGGAYDADQNRRLQAAGMAPSIYDLGFQDIAKLGQVGAAYESKSAEELQARMAEYQFNQNRELQKLQQYMQLIGGANYGGTTTTTGPDPYASNPWGDFGSAAMMGMALPKMFGV